MAIQSQISTIVASQTGKIQGELEARVLGEAFSITDRFTNECPTLQGLEEIVNTKNTLLKVINSFTKTTNRFNSLAKTLLPVVRIAEALIRLLKLDPTPIAIGTPPLKDFGGLISSKTAGMQNSSADRLRKVSLLLEALKDDVASIEALTGDVDPSLNQVRTVLNSIDTNILNCIISTVGATTGTGVNTTVAEGSTFVNIADIRENLNTSTENLTEDQIRVKELLKKIQPFESVTTGEVSAQDTSYTDSQGRIYTLEIITITEVDRIIPGKQDGLAIETEKVEVSYIAPKRYAQAKDRNGRVIVRGPASFSSSTQILLDELKFKLDNQLA